MSAPSKESIVLTLANLALSALATAIGSWKDFPLGLVAGLTVEFILIAMLGAGIGTIMALQSWRLGWAVGLVLALLAVPAVLYYSYLLSLGGLTLTQIALAGAFYFYIFLVSFFVFTYLENLLRQLGGGARS